MAKPIYPGLAIWTDLTFGEISGVPWFCLDQNSLELRPFLVETSTLWYLDKHRWAGWRNNHFTVNAQVLYVGTWASVTTLRWHMRCVVNPVYQQEEKGRSPFPPFTCSLHQVHISLAWVSYTSHVHCQSWTPPAGSPLCFSSFSCVHSFCLVLPSPASTFLLLSI